MDTGDDVGRYKQVGDLVSGSGASRDSRLLGDAPEPMDTNSRRQRLRAVRFARSLSVRFAMRHVQMIDSSSLNRAYALVLLSRVYIGGLNREVKGDELSQLLSTCGPLTYLHLPHTNSPRVKANKGFAFANFLMPEAALLAIETLGRAKLRGIPIRIGRPANMANIEQLLESLSGECPDRDRWVYVANVPDRATEADLRAALSRFGHIWDLRLQPDPKRPGQHRGFGFARFASAAAAEAAIEKRFAASCGDGVEAKQGRGSCRLPIRLGRIVSPPGVATGCLPSGMPPPAAAVTADINVDLDNESDISSSSSGSGHSGDDKSVQSALFSSELEEALCVTRSMV